jgi:hypothetical protein
VDVRCLWLEATTVEVLTYDLALRRSCHSHDFGSYGRLRHLSGSPANAQINRNSVADCAVNQVVDELPDARRTVLADVSSHGPILGSDMAATAWASVLSPHIARRACRAE